MVPAFRPRCQDGSASRDSGEADGFLQHLDPENAFFSSNNESGYIAVSHTCMFLRFVFVSV